MKLPSILLLLLLATFACAESVQPTGTPNNADQESADSDDENAALAADSDDDSAPISLCEAVLAACSPTMSRGAFIRELWRAWRANLPSQETDPLFCHESETVHGEQCLAENNFVMDAPDHCFWKNFILDGALTPEFSHYGRDNMENIPPCIENNALTETDAVCWAANVYQMKKTMLSGHTEMPSSCEFASPYQPRQCCLKLAWELGLLPDGECHDMGNTVSPACAIFAQSLLDKISALTKPN